MIAASYEGQTVIDSCDAFDDYRFDDLDFTWTPVDNDCYEDQYQGDCLPDISEYVDADSCYFQQYYDACSCPSDQCMAVIEVDGVYYPGKCEELAEMFGVPYGDDTEEADDEEETVEWIDCMDMFVDFDGITRCWYLEEADSC